MNNHKISNLQAPADVDIADFPNYQKDQRTVVNKGYLNSKFLKKDRDENQNQNKILLKI